MHWKILYVDPPMLKSTENRSPKNDFEKINFVANFQTINRSLKHLVILNIPLHILFLKVLFTIKFISHIR